MTAFIYGYKSEFGTISLFNKLKIFKGNYSFFDGKEIEECQLNEPVPNIKFRIEKQVQKHCNGKLTKEFYS